MSESVRPHSRQPTRIPCPWDFPGKNTEVGFHFLLQCMKVKSESEVAQSSPTLSDPMDCSPPWICPWIFQARVLEWGAIAFSTYIPRLVNCTKPSLNLPHFINQHTKTYIQCLIAHSLSTLTCFYIKYLPPCPTPPAKLTSTRTPLILPICVSSPILVAWFSKAFVVVSASFAPQVHGFFLFNLFTIFYLEYLSNQFSSVQLLSSV